MIKAHCIHAGTCHKETQYFVQCTKKLSQSCTYQILSTCISLAKTQTHGHMHHAPWNLGADKVGKAQPSLQAAYAPLWKTILLWKTGGSEREEKLVHSGSASLGVHGNPSCTRYQFGMHDSSEWQPCSLPRFLGFTGPGKLENCQAFFQASLLFALFLLSSPLTPCHLLPEMPQT